MKKTILRMRSNDLQWNPMEPLNFVVANEDYQAYTFDMRKLNQPTRIYKGHNPVKESLQWEYPQPEKHNPYDAEWEHLIAAIRDDQPYNEVLECLSITNGFNWSLLKDNGEKTRLIVQKQ